jgi:hypothetical protein
MVWGFKYARPGPGDARPLGAIEDHPDLHMRPGATACGAKRLGGSARQQWRPSQLGGLSYAGIA